MREANYFIVAFVFSLSGGLGCGGSQSAPDAPRTPAEPTAQPPGDPLPTGTESGPNRPSLTAEACEASGGVVVGDIGDGAIHRPEYRCPSGAAPSGTIRPPEGGPMAVEGSVCCSK